PRCSCCAWHMRAAGVAEEFSEHARVRVSSVSSPASFSACLLTDFGSLFPHRYTRVHAGILLLKGRPMAPHLPGTILVIDDEPSMVRALAGLLRRDGYLVGTASNGRHALAQLQERPYDVILCDLRMPELDGPAFYAILTRQYPALRQRVIFLTGDTGGEASTA